MIRHSETAKMSRTSYFFILGGQLASSGGQTLFSDSLKLQLYQHRGQLNLLKVEVYLKPPHLNIALWYMGGNDVRVKDLYVCVLRLIRHRRAHTYDSRVPCRVYQNSCTSRLTFTQKAIMNHALVVGWLRSINLHM